MKIIGLTGGIATGKSTVTQLLTKQGHLVIDADVIVLELQEKGSPLLKELSKAFGSTILNKDGSLNRDVLGKLIFPDKEKRNLLNSIIHPLVRLEFEKRIASIESDLLFLDIPLLFEAKFDDLADLTLVIATSSTKQLERLMLRDDLTKQEAQARIAAQMPLTEKIKLANFVIDNDGDLCELKEKIEKFLGEIKISKVESNGTNET